MTILIANIGTSDLTVKIDDYYFPIGFNRNEPNTDESSLTDDERAVWDRGMRENYIATQLCPELGVTVSGKNRFSFRELTQKLLDAYQANPEQWHPRIRPGRIWGASEEAKTELVKTVYLFITDHPPESKGYDSDSVYLFDILQLWASLTFGNEIDLKPEIVPKDVPAIDLDKLLQKYYNFFNQRDPDEKILISIKGGTPQMQTALRVQAMSSAIKEQIFLEPILSIKKLLAGEPSECQRISYWRYQRTQKYQTVKLLLLTRWDFDGARQILMDWQLTLKSITDNGVKKTQLADSQNNIGLVIKGLNVAVGYLNLDYSYASQSEKSFSSLQPFKRIKSNYNSQLNLYSQCRIYWHLDRAAIFLSRMSSFYEDNLHQLIIGFGGEGYFDKEQYPLDWYLNPGLLDDKLWYKFHQIESETKCDFRKRKGRDRDDELYKLGGRPSKRNFVRALIEVQSGDLETWDKLLQSFKRLDYWAGKRNQLIHSADGISKKRMDEVRKKDCANGKNVKKARNSCLPEQIIPEMSKIVRYTFTLLSQPSSGLLQFVGKDASHYIYDEIANWVVEQLDADAKR